MSHDWDWDEPRSDEEDGWGAISSNWSCACCGMNNNPIMPICEVCGMKRNAAAPEAKDISSSGMYGLFLSEATLQDHEKEYLKQKDNYKLKFQELLRSGISINSATKSRVGTVLYAHKEHSAGDELLSQLSPSEILTMLKLLDAPRKVRALKQKLQMLETRAEHSRNQKERPPNQSLQRVRQKTKKKIKFEIAMLERECLTTGSVTNSINKKVRRWIRAIPPHKLEFYLLHFPKEPWQQLSDICHCSPNDFTLEYFLPVIYNAELPPDSLVSKLQNATVEVIPSLLQEYPTLYTCYSYLRKKYAGQLSMETKKELATKAPLEDILWFYEEVHSVEVEEILHSRLSKGETISASGRERSSYGKLMERLLTFRAMNLKFVPELMNYAEQKLADITLAADSRVVVMGDASASMEVAIQVSTIIGSLVTVCLKAELLFFNDKLVFPSIIPTSANDVLKITEEIKAERCTSPALALYKFYKMRQPVDLFIVVSDEEENTPCQGMMFADLFKKYLKEVNSNAKIFLVSFLDGPPTFLGKMRAGLRSKGIGCQQFRLDAKRPDLSKLPHLLGMLSLETSKGVLDLQKADEDGKPANSSEERKEVDEMKEGEQVFQNQEMLQALNALSEEERLFLKNNPTKISEAIKNLASEDSSKAADSNLPAAPIPTKEPPIPEATSNGHDDDDMPS